MKLEDIKKMKDELEDIREDRNCSSEGLAQFSREIPRMGEAVTKSRSGPITFQDTSITRQMWSGTVLRKGNGKCLWRPERPGLRNETKRCAQKKKASEPWLLEGRKSAAPWEVSEELGGRGL